MEKDTIITLEDNEKFVLLDKVELENANYFLAWTCILFVL